LLPFPVMKKATTVYIYGFANGYIVTVVTCIHEHFADYNNLGSFWMELLLICMGYMSFKMELE
jgi:hypothetical protein